MKSRHLILWSSFALAILAAIFGWLWMLQRLVENDAELSQKRLRESGELYLKELSGNMPEKLRLGPQGIYLEGDFESFRSEKPFSGVWPDKPLAPGANPFAPPQDPQLSEVSPEDLKTFPLGLIEDGRDQLGSHLLRYFSSTSNPDPALVGRLEELVWRYRGDPINPGFRLLLIRALEKVSPSPALARLKLAETIRAVEGDVSQLEFEFAVIHGGTAVCQGSYFYTRSQLEALFKRDGIQLISEEPTDRASVKIEQLAPWPYLTFSDDSIAVAPEEKAALRNSFVLRTSGILIGLFILGLILIAAFIGRRQLRTARARTDLAAGIAHEFRTPLAGQRIVLETLQKRQEYDEEYLSMALRENERLSALSDDFLTFSRLERGILHLDLQPLQLSKIIEPLIHDFRSQCDSDSALKLVIEDDQFVLADPSAVVTIARNLIENAWKYSSSDPQITVTVFRNGFSVRDQGMGLSPADRRRIFKQFYRVDKKLSRSQDGLGLGLSIVQRLVDGMDGSIEVDSVKGKGSTFKIHLNSAS